MSEPSKLQTIILMLQQQFNNKKKSLHSKDSHKKQHRSYNNIESENRVLLYQLQIQTKVLQMMKDGLKDQQSELSYYLQNINKIQLKAQQQINQSIMSNNIRQLSQKCKNFQKTNQTIAAQLNTIQKQNEKLCKQNQILSKKCEDYERLGGKIGYQHLQDENTELKKTMIELSDKLTDYKDKWKVSHNRCNILQKMNEESEQKLAECMMRLQNIRQKREANKNQCNNNSSKIQLFSAKQQIRNLKNKIATLQSQREAMKQQINKKENLYSKMINDKINKKNSNQNEYNKENSNIQNKIVSKKTKIK